ncbi:MAG TPA: sigma factor-like helix-turn-helix DNA-binding protein [Candidatus Paceibacterota bacterium]|nr:sigma factor-like helix-turn-helix DNA-binding protein [Candidatus Paceibacterota bacterium]
MASIAKLISASLTGLNPRQKEVITARFGLDGKGEGETLAAIGDRMDVTRERVRQIENGAIVLVKANISKNQEAGAILEKVKKFIAGRGGVSRKGDVVQYASTLASGIRENHLDFLAEASGVFNLHREDDAFHPFYYVSDKDLKTASAFVNGWVGFLKSHKDKVFEGSYQVQLASFTKTKSVPQDVADNYLSISKQIDTNPYGDMGLREWPEISPATVRDKIYLVLKKKAEPLHFEDIATNINKVGFDDQKALAPTVHNELIKDNRFVLVGRGMYGLKEHGYEPGTAREVIAKVLKSKGPLKATDVVSHVNAQRFFKQNTILINLQNRNFFERMNDGRYRVRES